MDPVTFPHPEFRPGDVLIASEVDIGRCFTTGAEYTVSSDGRIRDDDGDLWPYFGSRTKTRFIRKTPTRIEATATPSDNIVDRPAHYTRWAIEPVEFLLRNRVEGHVFNIVKYVMRAGYKLYPGKDEVESEITDLRKVIRYAEMRINFLNGEDKL